MLQVHGTRTWVQDCWVVVRLWATTPSGQEFLADLSFEIDGRDFEFDPLWGDTEGDYFLMDLCDDLYQHECWPAIGQAMEAAN